MGNKLNVQFNDRQSKSLEEMADEMGTTKAGVLKTALALLEVAIRERKEGNSLDSSKGTRWSKKSSGSSNELMTRYVTRSRAMPAKIDIRSGNRRLRMEG